METPMMPPPTIRMRARMLGPELSRFRSAVHARRLVAGVLDPLAVVAVEHERLPRRALAAAREVEHARREPLQERAVVADEQHRAVEARERAHEHLLRLEV